MYLARYYANTARILCKVHSPSSMDKAGGSSQLGRSNIQGEKQDLEYYSDLEAMLSVPESPGGLIQNQNLQNELFNLQVSPQDTVSNVVLKRGANTSRNTRTRTTQVFNEKKKEIDKRYREKLREGKRKMELELQHLGSENAHLHDENTKFMMEKESINRSLQFAENETMQLQIEIKNLKKNMTNQQNLVHSFLNQLDVSNHDNHHLEVEKLQNEMMILRQDNWDDWSMDKHYLLQEIANFEHEKRVLQLQIDALCEKINNDVVDHGGLNPLKSDTC